MLGSGKTVGLFPIINKRGLKAQGHGDYQTTRIKGANLGFPLLDIRTYIDLCMLISHYVMHALYGIWQL